MTKAEWGTKRACPHCGAKFYDMMKSPIVCPKCEKVVEPEAPTRSRRSAPPKAVVAPKVVVPVAEPVEAEVEEGAEVVAEGAEEAEEAEVIEDTSDLGEDEDDVAEVLENVDESPEEER